MDPRLKSGELAEIARLGRLCGISPGYYDNQGRRHATPLAAYEGLLEAMGVPWEPAGQRRQEIARREAEAHDRLLPPTTLTSPRWRRPHLVAAVKLSRPETPPNLFITGELTAEDGTRLTFATHRAMPIRARWRPVPDGFRTAIGVALPPALPWGYYDLRLAVSGAGGTESADSRLLVAPRAAYLPGCLKGGRRLFGLSLPLYALRSSGNWGIGDFGDLGEAVEWAAELGAAFVGVNPLHAPVPHATGDPSPYSPATRIFLNFLYLDLTSVPELAASPKAQAFLASPAGESLLARSRAAPLVAYGELYDLKARVLRECYAAFRERHGGQGPPTARGEEFRRYLEEQDHLLAEFAAYAALAEFYGSGDWRRWPREYQNKAGPAVAAFAAAKPERLEFWQYVQWLAAEQLAEVRQRAQAVGLPFTLYQDLALGAAAGGFETWAFPHLFAKGAAIGAPPDAFNPKGQNWGLPPLIPERLRESGYELFLRTLRANLPPGGMLRLDHIMGLFRLFWIPASPAVPGAYVLYPARELLAMLALESHRARTLIIGEDLGTVAPSVRRELARRRIFSYKVFLFEREPDGRFRAPEDYPPQALAAVTTHDLPTLAGYWQGEDIALKERFHLYPQRQLAAAERRSREGDRTCLAQALAAQALLAEPQLPSLHASPTLPPEMRLGVLEYLGRSRAALLEVRLEEIFGLTAQQNLPGTVDEHPNWRQKFPLTLEEMRRSPEAAHLRHRLASARGGSKPPGDQG
jgi:4-alpha-glucanotransferase